MKTSDRLYILIIIFSPTYFKELGHDAREGTVSNEDCGADLNSLWKRFVGAGDFLGGSFEGVISADDQVLAGDEFNRLVVDEHASADLRALGVEHDAAGLVWSLLEGLLHVFNGLGVSLQNEVMRK